MDINENSIAVVTGAGSGMGAVTADYLESKGAAVARWDLKGTDIVCDVSDEFSVQQALAQTVETYGTPRILVNCAGILIGQKIVGRDGVADLEHFQKTIAVNLTGTYNTMRLVAAAMAAGDVADGQGQRGVIVNAASIAAFEGQVGQVAYSASKGGIVGMTLPAARDLARNGIRVVAIAPGAVETPMMAGVRDDIREAIEQNVPFPSRMAQPEEFAALVAHIVENDYLNGTVIRLDGGARLAAK